MLRLTEEKHLFATIVRNPEAEKTMKSTVTDEPIEEEEEGMPVSSFSMELKDEHNFRRLDS